MDEEGGAGEAAQVLDRLDGHHGAPATSQTSFGEKRT